MIDISDKAMCCGCNACGDVCAHDAITFKTDIEGFWYPEVDKSKCNNCGLCEKVCPIINIDKLKRMILKCQSVMQLYTRILKCVLILLPVDFSQLLRKKCIVTEVMWVEQYMMKISM